MKKDFLLQIDRAVFGLLKNFPDVFTNQSQTKQLQATQQENQHDDGGVSGHGNAPDELLQDDDQKIKQRGNGGCESQIGGSSQRRSGKSDDAVNGIPE